MSCWTCVAPRALAKKRPMHGVACDRGAAVWHRLPASGGVPEPHLHQAAGAGSLSAAVPGTRPAAGPRPLPTPSHDAPTTPRLAPHDRPGVSGFGAQRCDLGNLKWPTLEESYSILVPSQRRKHPHHPVHVHRAVRSPHSTMGATRGGTWSVAAPCWMPSCVAAINRPKFVLSCVRNV